MRHLLLMGALAAALSGCKSNPYCLNCGQTSGGSRVRSIRERRIR